ncbi:cell envelope integrity protein TolA [Marimonas arenosa]|uniref:Energy transducer TonB n=1 Tax=Marimonas arenosa TaxID=1795305 RepID=A0AAE3WDR9_9RHOB|nr:cell envelope integrity protein TolA [Marimonas arenosa]MDQ2091121.1 energy transducer TonB [Marimonas arenosa]
MNTGQVISGLGHIGLIGWMLFGGNFRSEPLPFDVTDVTVISEAEFEAMLAGNNAPDTVTDVAVPAAPEPEVPPAPAVAPAQDPAPEQVEPEVAETPPPEAPPAPVLPAPEPLPQQVEDQPPEVVPPPDEEVAALVPERSPEPQVRPVPRVAPEPVAQPPEPEAQPDPAVREETSDAPAEQQRPEEEATAPPEAVTEITPEADAPVSAAPATSVRPKVRPNRPAAPAPPDTTTTAVNTALAEALGGESGGGSSGAGSDPLTQGEKDGLILAIKQCWSVDPYAASGKVTVVVKVELNRDGSIAATPRFLSASGGDQAAIDVAFRNARTAVISCGRRGFDLPEEKYERWREIEITFNPEKMRLE